MGTGLPASCNVFCGEANDAALVELGVRASWTPSWTPNCVITWRRSKKNTGLADWTRSARALPPSVISAASPGPSKRIASSAAFRFSKPCGRTCASEPAPCGELPASRPRWSSPWRWPSEPTPLFSVIYAVLFNPLPYRDPDRLVWIGESSVSQRAGFETVNTPSIVDWRAHAHFLASIAALALNFSTFTAKGNSERVQVVEISESTENLLGVVGHRPRSFLPEEPKPGAGKMALLSHALPPLVWRRLPLPSARRSCD